MKKEIKEHITKVDFDQVTKTKDFIYDNIKKFEKDFVDDIIETIDFYKLTSLLTPQSRSPLWERVFIKKNGAKKVPSSKGRGDMILNGDYYEYKISGPNAGNILHCVQIRLFHDVDYIIQYIGPSFSIKTFLLTHAQMTEEAGLLKASNAHGTKEHNESNDKLELRFSIPPDSIHMKRWESKYLTTKFK